MLPVMDVALTELIWLAMIRPTIELALTLAMSLAVSVPVTEDDEVTTVHAWWAYDDEADRRPMVFHQAIAWAVNRDADGFVRALAMHRMFSGLPPEARPGACVAFAEAALKANPYALPAAIACRRVTPGDSATRTHVPAPCGQVSPLPPTSIRDGPR